MIKIQCREEHIALPWVDGETEEDAMMKEFGWLLKPIIVSVGSYAKALEKLNWKITTYKNV